MRLRNGEYGYGAVTKFLHWLTVAAIATQFMVGWTMEANDDALDLQKDQIDQLEDLAEHQDEATEEWFDSQIDRMEDQLDAREDTFVLDAFSQDGLSLPEFHVLLGLFIMVLAMLRVLWRTTTPLPPWTVHLSARERRLEASLEKLLLTLLLVVPGTGLLLIATGDDWLPIHIAAQLVLLAAITLHVGLVLKHTVVRPHRHLHRML
jgi:cytochrome b561